MIGLDTNVVVRYLAQDDARQSAIASKLLEQELSAEQPGFVSMITLCELAWVLADCYDADKAKLREVIEGLLESRQLVIESSELVWKAVQAWTESSADFSDALLGQVATANGCERVATFDRAATRLPSFELLA